MKLLDNMFAQQESTDDKLQAGACEVFGVWLVFFILWLHDLCSHCYHLVKLEVFPPFWELTEATFIVQHAIKFAVICWCQLCHQHPHKEIQAGQAEVMEEVLLHAPPTA